jgi:hypothetical protein
MIRHAHRTTPAQGKTPRKHGGPDTMPDLQRWSAPMAATLGRR